MRLKVFRLLDILRGTKRWKIVCEWVLFLVAVSNLLHLIDLRNLLWRYEKQRSMDLKLVVKVLSKSGIHLQKFNITQLNKISKTETLRTRFTFNST